MLISPTEPKVLRDLGKVSLLTEEYGCDILIWDNSIKGWMGVQRKEMADLVASVADGRFAEQMKKMAPLERRVVVIEGRGEWTTEGRWAKGRSSVSWTGVQQLLNSCRTTNSWTVQTERLSGSCSTVEWLTSTEHWAKKSVHGGGTTRGPVKKTWGTANDRDYQRHLLLGLDGMGPKLADAVLDVCGMPFGWKDGMPEGMLEVEGIGRKKVDRWVKAIPSTSGDQ